MPEAVAEILIWRSRDLGLRCGERAWAHVYPASHSCAPMMAR